MDETYSPHTTPPSWRNEIFTQSPKQSPVIRSPERTPFEKMMAARAWAHAMWLEAHPPQPTPDPLDRFDVLPLANALPRITRQKRRFPKITLTESDTITPSSRAHHYRSRDFKSDINDFVPLQTTRSQHKKKPKHHKHVTSPKAEKMSDYAVAAAERKISRAQARDAKESKNQWKEFRLEAGFDSPSHRALDTFFELMEAQALQVPQIAKFSLMILSIVKTRDWVGVCAALSTFLLSLVNNDTTSTYFLMMTQLIKEVSHHALQFVENVDPLKVAGGVIAATTAAVGIRSIYRAGRMTEDERRQGDYFLQAGDDPITLTTIWDIFTDPAFEASVMYQSVWAVLSSFTVAIPTVALGIFPSMEVYDSVMKRLAPAINIPTHVFFERLLHLARTSSKLIWELIETRDPEVLLGGANYTKWLDWATRLIEDTSLVTYEKGRPPPVILPCDRVKSVEGTMAGGSVLLRKMVKFKSPPQAIVSVEHMMTRLRMKLAQEKSFEANNHSRVTPYAIMMVGPARIGKTEMCHEIHAALMKTIGMPGTPDTIYNLRGGKHWDGFSCTHSSVLMDDPDKNPAAPTIENGGHVAAVNAIVNGNPYASPQAELHDKGRLYVRPFTLFYTTNQENAGVQGKSTDIGHFWGRFKIRLKMTLKPEFMVSKTNRCLDPAKVSVGDKAWIFEVQRFITLPETDFSRAHMETFWTTDSKAQVIAYISKKFVQHYTREAKRIEEETSTPLCEKCNEPKYMHEKEWVPVDDPKSEEGRWMWRCPGVHIDMVGIESGKYAEMVDDVKRRTKLALQRESEEKDFLLWKILTKQHQPGKNHWKVHSLKKIVDQLGAFPLEQSRQRIFDDVSAFFSVSQLIQQPDLEVGVEPNYTYFMTRWLFLPRPWRTGRERMQALAIYYCCMGVYLCVFPVRLALMITYLSLGIYSAWMFTGIRFDLLIESIYLFGRISVARPKFMLRLAGFLVWRQKERYYGRDAVLNEFILQSSLEELCQAPQLQMGSHISLAMSGAFGMLAMWFMMRNRFQPTFITNNSIVVPPKQQPAPEPEALISGPPVKESIINKGARSQWAQPGPDRYRQGVVARDPRDPPYPEAETVSFQQLTEMAARHIGRITTDVDDSTMSVNMVHWRSVFFVTVHHFFLMNEEHADTPDGEHVCRTKVRWHLGSEQRTHPNGATTLYRGKHYDVIPGTDLAIVMIGASFPTVGLSKFFPVDSQFVMQNDVDESAFVQRDKTHHAVYPIKTAVTYLSATMVVAGQELPKRRMWTYTGVSTQFGWCGNVIVLKRANSAWIGGIHTASLKNTEGFADEATQINVESAILALGTDVPQQLAPVELEQGLERSIELEDLHPNSFFNGATTLNSNLVGTISSIDGKRLFRQQEKTRMRATSFAADFEDLVEKYIGSDRYEFPIFKGVEKDGEFKHPILNTIRQLETARDMDALELNMAADDYLAGVEDLDGRETYRVLTVEEAIFGIPGGAIGAFDPKTSAGYPHFRSKEFLYGKTPEGWKMHPELHAQLDWIERGLEADMAPNPVVSWTLKDEGIRASKNADRRARVFSCFPFAFNLYLKRYLAPVMAHMLQHKQFFECYAGMNMSSSEASEFRRYMTRFGPKTCIDGDLRWCDKGLDSNAIDVIIRILLRIAKSILYSKKDQRRLYLLLWGFKNCIIYYKGDLMTLTFSNGSGSFATILFNSIYVSLLLRIAYLRGWYKFEKGEPPLFRLLIALATLGDDNFSNVASRLWWFTFVWIRDELKKDGKEFVPGDKTDGDYKHKDFSQCSFLKRRFFWSDDLKHWVARLEMSSIVRGLVMRKPSKISSKDQELAILQSARLEMFLYGRTDFESFSARAEAACDAHEISWRGKFKSYDELMASYASDHFQTWVPAIGDGENLWA